MADFQLLLQAVAVFFSLLSGGFWIATASNYSLQWPWQAPRLVPPEDLAKHQFDSNRRAALFAGLAAIAQAVAVVLQNPLLAPH